MAMVSTRLDMRLDKKIKDAAEKAAALKGMKSLTEYIVKLIEHDAEKTIREHAAISVQDDIFDRFVMACEKVDQPNKKLKEAKKFADEQGIV